MQRWSLSPRNCKPSRGKVKPPDLTRQQAFRAQQRSQSEYQDHMGVNGSDCPANLRRGSLSKGFVFGFLISVLLWSAALGIVRSLI
jgi:hypothetical protein